MSAAVRNWTVPLLEREQSIAALHKLLEEVRSSSAGRLVLVGAEAGVGKTALLRAFCESCRGCMHVWWGACEPLQTPRPLGPLADVAQAVGGELRELVMVAARPHEVALALVEQLRAT